MTKWWLLLLELCFEAVNGSGVKLQAVNTLSVLSSIRTVEPSYRTLYSTNFIATVFENLLNL